LIGEPILFWRNIATTTPSMSSAGPAGATLQLLDQARQGMGLAVPSAEPGEAEPKPDFRRKLARCWALLLARFYECLPLRCPKCGEPMRIIACVLDDRADTRSHRRAHAAARALAAAKGSGGRAGRGLGMVPQVR
jgi:hypothetical protein